MKNIILALLSLLTVHGFAQEVIEPQPEDFDKVMTFTEFWETVFDDDTTALNLMNIYVITRDPQEFEEVSNNILKKPKTLQKQVSMHNVYFRGRPQGIGGRYSSNTIFIDSTKFQKRVRFSYIGASGMNFSNSIFEDYAWLMVDDNAWAGISIDNSSFNHGYFFGISGGRNERLSKLQIWNAVLKTGIGQQFNAIDEIYIYDSKFLYNDDDPGSGTGLLLPAGGDIVSRIEIYNSIFEYPISCYKGKIENELKVIDSKLNYVAFNNLKLPEDVYETRFSWDMLDSSLAYVEFFQAENERGRIAKWWNLNSDSSVVKNEVHYTLKSKAYQFLNIYKAQGDLKSYNACYRDIKNFENKRLKYEYQLNPTLEGWFHWRLNQLISSYSDYGTNPSKAVIKSLWVILFFAMFYMFFPSEWDISSKSAIIANFKRIGDKSDKTASPIIKALAYIIVSFLNAFTLSINSFITLGFGNIPTKGIARYITILQGFIGWFLLTIFSVSLINQILN